MRNYHIFFSKLANKLKTDVLCLLRQNGPLSVNEISTNLNVEQSKLSHALSSLKKCSIVETQKIGKHRLYSLNKKTILPLLKLVEKHESENCKECWAKKKKSQ